MPGDPANEEGKYCNPGRGRDEVLNRQCQHWGKVAQRYFSAVPLPVCIGSKTHSCIKRRIRRNRAQPLGIQWKQILKSLQGVHHDKPSEVEQEHRNSVLLPIHFFIGGDSGHPVEEPLHRPENEIEKSALSPQYLCHELAQWFHRENEDNEIEGDLQNSVQRHSNISG